MTRPISSLLALLLVSLPLASRAFADEPQTSLDAPAGDRPRGEAEIERSPAHELDNSTPVLRVGDATRLQMLPASADYPKPADESIRIPALIGIGILVHTVPALLFAIDNFGASLGSAFLTGNTLLPLAVAGVGDLLGAYGDGGWAWLGQFAGGVAASGATLIAASMRRGFDNGRTVETVATVTAATLPVLGAVIAYEISHMSGYRASIRQRQGFNALPVATFMPNGGFYAGVGGSF